MTWNWQLPDWPNFTWNAGRLRKAEQAFLVEGGALAGVVRHLNDDDREQLEVEAISSEALTTSEIEGELLDRASVQSSIRRELGLQADPRRAAPAEEGVAAMIVDLYRSFEGPLSHDRLFGWHRKLMKGRADLRDVGRYRAGQDPMQVVSGPVHDPNIHFEAPPAKRVEPEMTAFLDWFERTSPHGDDPLPALTRAGIAHLYFESIHPFEDGNGRIGRAISEMALSQSLGRPTLTALAATILARRRAYYDALEAANKEIEISAWLAWFAGATLEAQRRTAARVEFMLDKTKLLDGLRGRLNERQEKAVLRMLREGPEGFKGGLSAGNYMTITGTSASTATRDLAELVEKGALERSGEKRYARYHLPIPLRPVPAVTLDENGGIQA